MSAVSEQLVGDYLERMFAAGRRRLSRAERYALVARTREFIAQKTGPPGTVSGQDVARFLYDLGDPAGIVDAERARLAAARGESVPGAPDRGGGLGRWLWRLPRPARSQWPSQPAGSPQLTRELMAAADEDAAAVEADEPVLTGTIILPTDPHGRDAEPAGPDLSDERPDAIPGRLAANHGHDGPQSARSEIIELGPRPSWPTVVARNASWLDSATGVAGPMPEEQQRDEQSPQGQSPDGEPPDGEPPGGEPLGGEPLGGEPLGGEPPDEALDEEPPEGDTLDGLLLDPGVLDPDELDPDELDPDELDRDELDPYEPDEDVLDEEAPEEVPLDAASVAGRWSRIVVRRSGLLAVWVADRFRRQPVESLAATLLGIGGAAFPPVWLLGAAMALASRLWDGRDKWAGLALPVLATVVGTVIGVCLTAGASLAHDVHNAWLFADVLSRIAALLGAAYLAWRAVHGRRPPAIPPWTKAHRVG